MCFFSLFFFSFGEILGSPPSFFGPLPAVCWPSGLAVQDPSNSVLLEASSRSLLCVPNPNVPGLTALLRAIHFVTIVVRFYTLPSILARISFLLSCCMCVQQNSSSQRWQSIYCAVQLVCTSSHTNNNFIRNMDILFFFFLTDIVPLFYFAEWLTYQMRALCGSFQHWSSAFCVSHSGRNLFRMRGMTSTRPDLLADLNRSIFLFFSPLAEYKPFYFYFIF